MQNESNDMLGISVVIAHYNAPKKLVECLESVFKVNYPKFEVIVVDDGSDRPIENEIKDFPIKLIQLKENVGNGQARHEGAMQANNEVLLFIDGDITLPMDAFTKIDKAIRLEGNNAAIGMVDPEPLNPGFASEYIAMETHYLGLKSDGRPHQFFIALCGAIWKKDYFAHGGMYHRHLDDLEFSSRLPNSFKIKTDKTLNFRHHYSEAWVVLKKFFKRSYHYMQLEERKPNPWYGTSRKLGVMCGFFSFITLLLFAFSAPWSAIPEVFLAIFLINSLGFFFYGMKRKGVVFAIKGLAFKYLISISIGLGSCFGILKKLTQVIMFRICQLVGPFRIYLRRKSPTYAIFYITGKCNSRCSYCFQWELLNEKDRIKQELTYLEYLRLAKSLGPMEHITLGGGEPFLRRDISDIATAFYKYTAVRSFAIPTNGLRPDYIEEHVERIIKNCPNMVLKITLSIDGVGEEHDRLRGVKGSYQKIIESDQVLRKLRGKYSNLYYIVNTCYNRRNQGNALNTIQENRKRFDHDMQVITFVRGAIADINDASDADINAYFDIVAYLGHVQTIEKKRVDYKMELFTHALQLECRAAVSNVLTKHEGKYTCTAGTNMVVVDELGNVNPCEILPGNFTYGNLRRFDMSMSKILNQDRVRKIQKRITKEKCFCTWECAQINSIAFSAKGYLNLFRHMYKISKRRKRIKSIEAEQDLSFEEFKVWNRKNHIKKLPGDPVHSMVFEGEAHNSFSIYISDGETKEGFMVNSAMTDEQREVKRKKWLRGNPYFSQKAEEEQETF